MAQSPYDLSCWWDVKHQHNNTYRIVGNLMSWLNKKISGCLGLCIIKSGIAFELNEHTIKTHLTIQTIFGIQKVL